jgi:hypothetical protein
LVKLFRSFIGHLKLVSDVGLGNAGIGQRIRSVLVNFVRNS